MILNYLQKSSKSIRFRYQLPKAFIKTFNKREFIISLSTDNLDIAVRRSKELRDLASKIKVLKNNADIEKTLELLHKKVYGGIGAKVHAVEDINTMQIYDAETLQKIISLIELRLPIQSQNQHIQNTYEQATADLAFDLEALGLDIEQVDDWKTLLLKPYIKSQIKCEKDFRRYLNGDIAKEKLLPMTQRTSNNVQLFSEIFEVWIKTTDIKPNEEVKYRSERDLFLTYLKDRRCDEYESYELGSFFDILFGRPRKHGRYKGMTPERMIAEIDSGRVEEDETIAPSTARLGYDLIYRVFKFAARDGRFENPTLKLDKRKVKTANKRGNFSILEIQKLVDACAIAIKNNVKDVEKYWALVCLIFSGGRSGEIRNLYVTDILKSGDRYLFSIHEGESDDYDKTAKTVNATRLIPIHKSLERLGFKEWVNKSNSKLFPSIFGNSYASPYSNWFNKLLQELDIPKVNLENELSRCLHSTRHTFVTECMNHLGEMTGVSNLDVSALVGHSVKSKLVSVTSSYTHKIDTGKEKSFNIIDNIYKEITYND